MQLTRLKTNRITIDYFLIDLIKTQLVFIEFPNWQMQYLVTKSCIFV